MCGIFALLNNQGEYLDSFIDEQFQKGKGRGPESSKLSNITINTTFGFHRLAINGLNPESDQPLVMENIALICNGEIYNYKELYRLMNVSPTTGSDCEVIIHLYKKYGIEQTLQMLDGVFAFVLCDYDYNTTELILYVARDPYGVRPLYCVDLKTTPTTNQSILAFASELKVLNNFAQSRTDCLIQQFQPGTCSKYSMSYKVNSIWVLENTIMYHGNGFHSTFNSEAKRIPKHEILQNIQGYLMKAVQKRVETTDRPIACLLSGGLDSSLITALVNEECKKYGKNRLETYSIGLEGSEDLRCAKMVAEYLGTKHTEILLTEEDFINAIPEVIRAIESYDTTSVRASIGNYLLGKYISENSEAKVIFNGDGSDELCGGYLYMGLAPDAIEFDKECRRLLHDISFFDVLRSDKCISTHGLEPRTPFLDRTWVQYYLSIHPEIRFHPLKKECEKHLLRSAFSCGMYLNNNTQPLLPESILWRRKEAFSDGVSKTTRSLYEIIQEYCEKNKDSLSLINPSDFCWNTPKTIEQIWYRSLFESYYPGMGESIPYFWLPKYVNATDASARTLEIYNSTPNGAPRHK